MPLSVGGAGSPSNTTSPGPPPISVPSGTLIHPAVWPQTWTEKGGAAVPPPFLDGGAGPHLTQCGLGRGLPPYQITMCHLDLSNRLTTIHQRHGRTDRHERSDSMHRANRFTNGRQKKWKGMG